MEAAHVDAGHEELRPLMFSIAYRMTGTVGDAEAFIRAYRAEESGTLLESPRAFLATMTTRLAIDHLRSARVRRESYVGTWLPEPLVADTGPGPAERAELADSLSLAFLVLLESLSPVERPCSCCARCSAGRGAGSTRAGRASRRPGGRAPN